MAMIDSRAIDLERENAELRRLLATRETELAEALERQTATAEMLAVINSSPGALAPVFAAILDKAHALCGAETGVLLTYDGERFWPAAAPHAESARFVESIRAGFRPPAANPFARVVEGAPLVHIEDVMQVAAQHPDDPALQMAAEGGIRTFLIVPLRRDGVLLGAITANRREVRLFSEKQIALLQNFAAQAVIAMDNARFLTETREALEQQTATAEVLGVINSSPGDLAPVFDAMLEKATNLCEAAFGQLLTFDGGQFRAVALRGVPEFAEIMRGWGPFRAPPGTALDRVIQGESLVHIPDVETLAGFGSGGDGAARALVEVGKCRTLLSVALRKDGALLGVISVYRQEVKPFTDKQIALLQNFAAQAVIAIENARLLTETREALEQQTATAEVLQVINSSPGDLAPVFGTILEKAMALCEASFGSLLIYDGERFQPAADRGHPVFARWVREQAGLEPQAGTTMARIAAGENTIHIADAAGDIGYRDGGSVRRAVVEIGGFRTLLSIALRTERELRGVIHIFRQEVRPFTDKQIALLQNFAAQAVIAMENARLLTETREALEQQTATAEVLQVINSSPGDLAPVFDAILKKALTLCEAAHGHLTVYQDGHFHCAAAQGDPRFVEWF
ncbi:MAG: GAF domain-containing protein, partial [Acetobacteraceae bacterium]|nr:GAF domain-containing protein [Acetobacteraceae bacterium]